MRQRHIITRTAQGEAMKAEVTFYDHPECIGMIHPIQVIAALQDVQGRALDISTPGVRETLRAESPFAATANQRCSQCDGLLSEPPIESVIVKKIRWIEKGAKHGNQ